MHQTLYAKVVVRSNYLAAHSEGYLAEIEMESLSRGVQDLVRTISQGHAQRIETQAKDREESKRREKANARSSRWHAERQLAAESKKLATVAQLDTGPPQASRASPPGDAPGPTTIVLDEQPTRDQVRQAVELIRRREQYLLSQRR